MANNNFIVSIDIGSSKIAILLAEESNGRLEIFGHGVGYSAGVKRGLVVDVAQLVQAVQAVVETARLSCNTHFHNVSVNISDPKLRVINREGQIAIAGSKITEKDVAFAMKTASTVPALNNAQVISSVANSWTLDKDPVSHQGTAVEQPIGQEATTLAVNMHMVVASNQVIDATEQGIRQAGLGLSNMVPTAMASSEAYITQDEKDHGVCLLDMGAGVTNVSVFVQGSINHSAVIEFGGGQITQDIANAFNTSFAEAERLKIEYGHSQLKLIHTDKLIEFQQINSNEVHYLSHQDLVGVVEQGYLRLFSQIRDYLKTQKLYRSLKSGFVLTGGGSKVLGCDDLLLSCCRMRTKLGRVNTNRITATNHSILDPVYGCALGLLLFDPNESDLRQAQLDDDKNLFGKIKQRFNF